MYNVEQYITVEKCSREGDVSLQIREEVIERIKQDNDIVDIIDVLLLDAYEYLYLRENPETLFMKGMKRFM